MKKIIIFFLVTGLIKYGYSQYSRMTILSDEDFYEQMDRFLDEAVQNGHISIDSSEGKGIRIIFIVEIDTNAITHNVSIIKDFSYGLFMSSETTDYLCNWIKNNLFFKYLIYEIPGWRFENINNSCTYTLPYNQKRKH